MKIRWNGHSCFTLTNEAGHTLMTDPFNPGCGYPCPSGSVDIVTTSHHHHDHDYVESLTSFGSKIDSALEGINELGFEISSMASFHDECNGAKRGNNMLFKIKADGQTVVHLGDLGHYPDGKQVEFLSGADVMLIPIGGFFTIDTKTAVRIIEATAPKAVIAMHYKAGENEFPIADASEFISLTGAVNCEREEQISNLKGCCIFKFA